MYHYMKQMKQKRYSFLFYLKQNELHQYPQLQYTVYDFQPPPPRPPGLTKMNTRKLKLGSIRTKQLTRIENAHPNNNI